MCFINVYKKIILIVLALSFLLMTGCSTVEVSPERVSQIKNSEKDALLLISIGRKDRSSFLLSLASEFPFVDYRIYKVENNELIYKGTLQSEVVQLHRITGHLGEGKYGVIHLKELPAGDYLLFGFQPGDPGSVVPMGGGVMYVPGMPSSDVELAIKLKLIPGKINYVGEILVSEFKLEKDNSIIISNQIERDFEFISRNEGIDKGDVIINLANRVNLK